MRKNIFLFGFLLFILHNLCAQAPHSFNYQAVVRDTTGNIIKNQTVSLKVSIISDSINGIVVYSENHNIVTNKFGLLNVLIGNGIPETGDFLNIDWGSNAYYLKTEMDLSGGSSFVFMGITKLLSVPYSLFSQRAGNVMWNADGGNIYYNGGNVGIGTADPQSALEIAGNSFIHNGLTVNGGSIILRPQGNNGSNGQFLQTDGTGNVSWSSIPVGQVHKKIEENDSKVEVFDTSGSFISFVLDSVEKIRLTTTSLDFLNNSRSVYIGYEAGNSISGNENGNNVFIGYKSGYNNNGSGVEGSNNIFIGDQAGYLNSSGSYNVFVGDNAGRSNDYGDENVMIGDNAGYENYGNYNVFIGSEAGSSNTDAWDNVFIGSYAGTNNITGENNVFLGSEAGYYSSDGWDNVFMGWRAGSDNSDGDANVFVGSYAGEKNISGLESVFIGYNAGSSNEYGDYNVFLGSEAGSSNINADDNVFLGAYAGTWNIDGSQNVLVGSESGKNILDGDNNVMLGYKAGFNNNSGNGNVFIGYNAGYHELSSNKLYISNSDTIKPLIYGEFNTGVTTLNDVLKLTPKDNPPVPAEKGMIYYDNTSNTLKFFNGTDWINL